MRAVTLILHLINQTKLNEMRLGHIPGRSARAGHCCQGVIAVVQNGSPEAVGTWSAVRDVTMQHLSLRGDPDSACIVNIRASCGVLAALWH